MWRGFQGRQAISGDSGTRARARVDWAAGAEVALLGPSFSAPSWGESRRAQEQQRIGVSLSPKGKGLESRFFFNPVFVPGPPDPGLPGLAELDPSQEAGRGGEGSGSALGMMRAIISVVILTGRLGEGNQGLCPPPSGRDQRSCSVVTGQAPLMGVSLWGGTARDAAFLSWAGINPMVLLKCVLQF